MPTGCRLAIRAIPNAPHDAIAGWLGESLKVKVQAPALDGRANLALCAFLAQKLGLPRRAVSLVQGEKSRQKVVQIDGMTLAEVQGRVTAVAD